MPWAKLDDQFPDHPKVAAAGPTAGWLFVCGLCYCSRYLTDGFIPHGQLRKLADIDGAAQTAEILCRVGLWDAVPGGYQIHDYLEYNPSREQVMNERNGARERMRNLRSDNVRANTHRTSNGVHAELARNSPSPVPVPIPIPESHSPAPNGVAQGSASRPPDAPVPVAVTGHEIQVELLEGNEKSRPKELARTSEVWEAYASAYGERYGVAPARNAKVNGQLSQFLKRIPADDAPLVAAWYVGHQGAWYVKRGHVVECLLKDAETLYTQWQTGRRITSQEAREADRLQGAGDMWRDLAAERSVKNGR